MGIPCLGFAFLRALFLLYSGDALYNTVPNEFFFAQFFRGMCALIVVVLVAGRQLDGRLSRATLIPATTLATVATTVLFLLPFEDGSPWALLCFVVAHACLGWLYVCWGEAFAYTRVRDVAVSVALSIAVSLLLGLAISALPSPFRVACMLVIPALSTSLFLFYQHRGYPDEPYRAEFVGRSESTGLMENGRWFLALSLFALSTGVVHVMSTVVSSDINEGGYYLLYVLLAVGLSVLLLVGAYVRDGVLSLSFIWLLFSTVACVALGLAIAIPDLVPVAFTVFAAMRYVAFGYLNIKLADIAHHSKYPAYVVFALGWGVLLFSQAMGAEFAMTIVAPSGITAVLVVTLVTVALTGVLFVIDGSSFSDVRIGSKALSAQNSAAETIADIQYRQCQALRERYGLTDRETEVVLLIARGYSQPHCADALMVSLNTVRTHMKRIYAKLDIHTKDELLEALENPGK